MTNAMEQHRIISTLQQQDHVIIDGAVRGHLRTPL